MATFIKSIQTIAVPTVFIITFLSGCANSIGSSSDLQYDPNGNSTSSNSSAASASNQLDPNADFNGDETHCNNRKRNILGVDTSTSSSSFTACDYKEDFYSVEVWGELEIPNDNIATGAPAQNGVCFFPAQVFPGTTGAKSNEIVDGYSDKIVFKPDAQGLPMRKCFKLPAGSSAVNGIKLTFADTYFDYLYVTHLSTAQAMSQCLISGYKQLCPEHTEGQFRTILSKTPQG